MKYIKKITISSLVLILGLGIAGCDKGLLDEDLRSSTSLDNYYKIEGEVDLAMNGVYARFTDEGFWRALMLTVMSDVPAGVLSGGAESNGSGDKSGIATAYDNFNFTQDLHETSAQWDSHWDGINRANTLLYKLPDANISDTKKAWYEGQTKFLRAYFYWDLLKLYGDIPIRLEATLGLDNLNVPRSPVSEVYPIIEQDLKDAEKLLSPYSASDKAMGRATSAAAKTLLAKVYLQQHKWPEAAAKAKEVMDMGVFELWADYHDIFNPENDGGKEIIWYIPRGGAGNPTGDVMFAKAVYLWGPPPTTLPDGTSVDFNVIKFPITMQVNRDFYNSTPNTYRKSQTMTDVMPYYYNGGTLVNESVQLYAPFLIKYRYMDFGIKNLQEGVCTPVLRYSDVLLMYAEAVNESSQGPTDAAYNAINEVRWRARAVGTSMEQPESVYPDLSGLSEGEFREAVIVERLREFVGEEKSREDLLRQDRFISDAVARGVNAEDNNKVYPIPGTAMSVNPELVQNPGY